MNVINKSDVNVSVIPNGLEKYMVFAINKDVVFIDNKEFMNYSLEKLVKTYQTMILIIYRKNSILNRQN